MEKYDASNLGGLIRSTMENRRISLRALSRLSGIGLSTLSRIINGKQQPGLIHLQAFAQHLGIPLPTLLHAAGIDSHAGSSSAPTARPIPDILCGLLDAFGIDLCALTAQVQGTLETYRQYAATDEGDRMIRRLFSEKIQSVGGSGVVIDTLNSFYDQYCGDALPHEERILYGSALLYFVMSTDAIPDYLFPFGYLDDALALYLVQLQLEGLCRIISH